MSWGAKYRNPYPHPPHGLLDVLRWKTGWHPPGPAPEGDRAPRRAGAPAVVREPPPPRSERVGLTWIGHSTFLIEYRGLRILTDPIFGNILPLLPVPRFRRLVPPGIAPGDLPPIDEVLISHSHYDHLDTRSIRLLGERPRYWVPRGLGAWFRRHGFDRSVELDWWQSVAIPGLGELHCVPAQHFSARGLFDRDRTLWCGWVLRTPGFTVYFAGDTAYCPLFQELGSRFGGADLALLPIGAYSPRWLMGSVHANPDEAVAMHIDLGSRLSVACHWGTFRLTDEPPDEPPALLARARERYGVAAAAFRVLAPGETISPGFTKE